MASSRKRREQNPRLRKEEYRRWKERTPKAVRSERHMRDVYGMGWPEYTAMLERQGGGCALCGTTKPKRFDVDHDHDTGAVRGLLCRTCNNGVGHVERLESLGLLVAVRTYIAASKALTLVA